MKNTLSVCFLLLITNQLLAIPETFRANDVHDLRKNAYALINASVTIDSETQLSEAILLIKDGKVVDVGKNLPIPNDYTRIDMQGLFIYPGLIDIYSHYGLTEPNERPPFSFNKPEVLGSQMVEAYGANDAIKSYYSAAKDFEIDEKEQKRLRKLGFSSVLSFRADGIARGTSTLVSLAKGAINERVLEEVVAAHYSYDKGSSTQSFPISPMGAMALLRQTYLDAAWYAQYEPRPFTDLSLEAWLDNQALPQIFEVDDWQSLLRLNKLAKEFEIDFIVKGAGDEYQRALEIKKTGFSLILPLNFPQAMDVEDAWDSQRIGLQDMKHWELAPSNPAVMASQKIVFALTSQGSGDDFWKNLRRAVEHGLSKQQALRALTQTPAKMIQQEHRIGTLRKASLANFLVSSGDLFSEDTVIYQNWIQGQSHLINKIPVFQPGAYQLSLEQETYRLEISGSVKKQVATLKQTDSEDDISVTLAMGKNLLSMRFRFDKNASELRFNGWKDGEHWRGQVQLDSGDWAEWSLHHQGELEVDEEIAEQAKPEEDSVVGDIIYPFQAYGFTHLPQQETLLIKNATVWTLEQAGVLQQTDVLLEGGKIKAIGKSLTANNARIIDAQGKHLTPGIVDEHSHIALSGVNDIAVNSAMVRMDDVVDSTDINIYRNLAGGVTSAQLLHGSANPVGGQSALIKLRWGSTPEAMLIENADGFIKFALGENVKRAANNQSIRFPQTRMGVEQVYEDWFSQAVSYRQQWSDYQSLSKRKRQKSKRPRRDLVLETMVEIMQSKRFVTSHSYVQSEINMLMKVAEKYDFRINTFTHILEGYKVADKMAEHGAGGSTFADWWAYKWEVRYAIPYNATLMHEAGLTVAINSDSGEMSRRLNQEAAKSVKYGNLSETEALKLVTLNPAKLLHLDDRMGSIKLGKDADLVVWSGHPLSIYSKPETTIIDGIVYFDLERDLQYRDEIKQERARLVQKLRNAKSQGAETTPAKSKPKRLFQCDSIHGYEYLNLTAGA